MTPPPNLVSSGLLLLHPLVWGHFNLPFSKLSVSTLSHLPYPLPSLLLFSTWHGSQGRLGGTVFLSTLPCCLPTIPSGNWGSDSYWFDFSFSLRFLSSWPTKVREPKHHFYPRSILAPSFNRKSCVFLPWTIGSCLYVICWTLSMACGKFCYISKFCSWYVKWHFWKL